MKSDLTIKNRYCTIPQAKFRKWDEMDVLLWMLGKMIRVAVQECII